MLKSLLCKISLEIWVVFSGYILRLKHFFLRNRLSRIKNAKLAALRQLHFCLRHIRTSLKNAYAVYISRENNPNRYIKSGLSLFLFARLLYRVSYCFGDTPQAVAFLLRTFANRSSTNPYKIEKIIAGETLDSYEYNELLKELTAKIENIRQIVAPERLRERLEEIEKIEQGADFWNDAKHAAKVQQEKNKIVSMLKKYDEAATAVEDAKELLEMAQAEGDTETIEELYADAENLKEKVTKLEIEMMLSGEDDSKNAIVTIHPGAGGTESQDWASMLYRMYLRWAERMGFKVEELDYQAGEEAGIKDVSFIVKGENAYGYLKAENGIHRLVRISPFDSNAKRHTSFTSVMVSPEVDDDIDIEIEEKDIRVDTYRASGAGGQHVNKTDSAIRITHIPTGIVVQCQNDRSQHKNRANAMKMLKSRLYELELEKQKAAKEGIEKSEIGWGHQIRSYVLAPYRQVKDNRSGIAYSNVDAILDGDITKVIEDVLIAESRKES